MATDEEKGIQTNEKIKFYEGIMWGMNIGLFIALIFVSLHTLLFH